jgi:hypothetical protein
MRRRPAADAGILPLWPVWRARGDSRTPAEPIVKHIGIWCTSKDWVDFERKTKTGAIRLQQRRPDTFWLELFDGDNSHEITDEVIKHFLHIFGLSNRVSWNRTGVAACVKAVRSSATFSYSSVGAT